MPQSNKIAEAACAWTPGPWHAGPADMFGDHNIILRDNEDCRAVAAVVSNMRLEDEVAANARLIAAAPDLAQSVHDLLDMLTDGIMNCHDERIDEVTQAARTALSKATGEGEG